MAKKFLFVNKSFELGGVQSALNNMLKEAGGHDQIDLLAFHKAGVLLDQVPDNVRILEPALLVQTLGMTFSDCLKRRNILQIFFKIVSTGWSRLFGNYVPIAFALLFQRKLGPYDAAVAYHHETSRQTMVSGFVRFVLKRVDAKLKVGWIHSDFNETKLGFKQNKRVYEKLDKIICVSEATRSSFLACFPELAQKCRVCYNMLPAKDLVNKSRLKENVFAREHNETIFFSACRLTKEKGLHRAIDAMLPLIKQGEMLKWYIAGTGPLKESIADKIKANGAEGSIILLGYLDNPYPYIKEADWYLMTSYHETFSMTAAEAKLLGTPVLAVDIPVMRELIDDFSGLICDNSEAGIRDGLKKALQTSLRPLACAGETKNNAVILADIINEGN